MPKSTIYLLMVCLSASSCDLLKKNVSEVIPPESKPDSSQMEKPTAYSITEISPFPAAVHGMCLSPAGDLYFADTYKKMGDLSRVYILSPPYTGKARSLPVKADAISGLMWFNNQLYVALLEKSEIRVYSSEFELLKTYSLRSPWSFASYGNEVYILNYFGSLFKIAEEGPEQVRAYLSYPFDVEFTMEGDYWISEQVGARENGKLTLFDQDHYIKKQVDYPFSNPEGIALAENGNLVIADTGAGKILEYSLSADTVYTISERYALPICAISTEEGRVFINTNHEGGTLLILDPIK